MWAPRWRTELGPTTTSMYWPLENGPLRASVSRDTMEVDGGGHLNRSGTVWASAWLKCPHQARPSTTVGGGGVVAPAPLTKSVVSESERSVAMIATLQANGSVRLPDA